IDVQAVASAALYEQISIVVLCWTLHAKPLLHALPTVQQGCPAPPQASQVTWKSCGAQQGPWPCATGVVPGRRHLPSAALPAQFTRIVRGKWKKPVLAGSPLDSTPWNCNSSTTTSLSFPCDFMESDHCETTELGTA